MNGYTDIHCHILPGVDDGAEDMLQAMALLRMAYDNGTRTLILTPHYRGKYKKNDPGRLREVFKTLLQRAQKELPGMALYLGNEVFYETEIPKHLETGRALSLNGSRYCLLEFSSVSRRAQIIAGISEILCCGFTPIIAHAERYEVFQKDKTLTDEVLAMGALIQLNADSIMGKHGLGVMWYCGRLLKEQKAHFVATDAHDAKMRPPLLRKCWWHIYKKYGTQYATRLFYGNAQAVIENKMV